MRLCTSTPPERYWAWIAEYPYETSLVVICATQTATLASIYAAGSPLGYNTVPGWLTLAVGVMFAACAALLAAGLLVGTAGLMATALRATLIALLTLIGMVMPSGVTGPETVLIAQAVPLIVLTAARSCYVEKTWRVRTGRRDTI